MANTDERRTNADNTFSAKDRREYAQLAGFHPDSGFHKTGDNAAGEQVVGNPHASAKSIAKRFQTSETDTSVSKMASRAYGHMDFDRRDPNSRGPAVPYALSNNPRAGQWDGRKVSRRKIAAYKRFVVTDGEGVRNSIYVSGCLFRCKGCWNASIWNFNVGHPYTKAFENAVIDDLKPDYVEGITYLGGEPFLNTPVLLAISKRVRETFGHRKNIWCWTGYTWEELMRPGTTPDKIALLRYSDILIDGRFILAKKSSLTQFRGSTNQRVIDVPASIAARRKALKEGKVRPGNSFCGIAAEDSDRIRPVIWSRLHDRRVVIPEENLKQRTAHEGSY